MKEFLNNALTIASLLSFLCIMTMLLVGVATATVVLVLYGKLLFVPFIFVALSLIGGSALLTLKKGVKVEITND